MMADYRYYTRADRLPPEWDMLSDSYFSRKAFLMHTERYNPCRQRYYMLAENGILSAAAIVYTLQLDLLTFIRIKSPVKMHICGVPCSVSQSGLFGESDAVMRLKSYIYEKEKGFVLFLNLKSNAVEKQRTGGPTLPTVIFNNVFSDRTAYHNALRAPYRRRLKRIGTPVSGLTIESLPCGAFDARMYALYLEVYKRSSGKLEKLGADFFRCLPDDFSLRVCRLEGTVIGWHITMQEGGVLYFFLGGVDYNYNKKYNTYFRLLADIVYTGMDKGLAVVELGQTAEVPKLRLGGQLQPLYMEARHSNALLNRLLNLFGGLLVYRRKIEHPHVFREGLV